MAVRRKADAVDIAKSASAVGPYVPPHDLARERIARRLEALGGDAVADEVAPVEAVRARPSAGAVPAEARALAVAGHGEKVAGGDDHFFPFALIFSTPFGFHASTK